MSKSHDNCAVCKELQVYGNPGHSVQCLCSVIILIALCPFLELIQGLIYDLASYESLVQRRKKVNDSSTVPFWPFLDSHES